MSSSNSVVVVTGASAGAGRAIAERFGRAGWSVGLLARGREGLESAARDIEALGGHALPVETDVADAEAVRRAADRIERELGPIDVWVNNAMVTVYATCEKITPEEFLQVTRVTYLGQVHGTLAALAHMKRRDRGAIVCVGSALAYRSIPFQGPYCAAKAAVRAFIDSLRSELMWEGSRVRLSVVHLPAVNTPQFWWARNKSDRCLAPVPPIYQPETVGEAVFKAAHTGPREVWLGFSTVKAVVGQMLAPAFADRVLARAGISNETRPRPKVRGQPDNLFEAGAGDPGTHGPFDSEARRSAISYNPTYLRGSLMLAVLAALLAGSRAAVVTVADRGFQRWPGGRRRR